MLDLNWKYQYKFDYIDYVCIHVNIYLHIYVLALPTKRA